MRVLLSGILLFALCSPAFAQDAGAMAQNFAWLGDNMRQHAHARLEGRPARRGGRAGREDQK